MAEASILDFQLSAIMDAIALAAIAFPMASVFIFGLLSSEGESNG